MSQRKRLISNFTALSSVQAANYLLPLVTLPYLTRILGPAKFGLVAFAQATVMYLILLTDYGFNLSATRDISVHRQDNVTVSKIFSSIMAVKTILMAVSFLLLYVLITFVGRFADERMIYLYSFGMVIGNVLFPVWFFQGMERMKLIALLNILSRAIFTVSIFVFIKQTNDYVYVPLISSLGYIVSGIVAVILVLFRFRVRLMMPTFDQLKGQLRAGFHVFVSTMAVSFYTISNTFILGLFTSDVIVGYYSAAEKVVRAVQGLLGPFSQTIYPYMSKLASESRHTALLVARKAMTLVGSFTFIMSSCLLIFAHQITALILGRQFVQSTIVIQIMAFLPFLVAFSNLFGIQVMLNFGMEKLFMRILIAAAAISITLALILVSPLQHIGISITAMVTEMFVSVTMFVTLYRHGLKMLPVSFFNRGINAG